MYVYYTHVNRPCVCVRASLRVRCRIPLPLHPSPNILPPPTTGTEITSLKDVLTDMNITQKPLDNAKDTRLIHSGFHAAFNSVVGNVYECVEMVLGQGGDLEADGWTVRLCSLRYCGAGDDLGAPLCLPAPLLIIP